jgi:uncharacterized protein (TIGR00251 family)
MNGFTDSGDGCVLAVHVVPRASRTEVAGLHGASLKIRLQAPPVDGKANRVLLRYLADRLGVPASSVELLSGETGREKRIRVAGVSAASAAARLAS